MAWRDGQWRDNVPSRKDVAAAIRAHGDGETMMPDHMGWPISGVLVAEVFYLRSLLAEYGHVVATAPEVPLPQEDE